MALVNVTNVVVMDNPAPFRNDFQFEVTFECLQELQDDLEWKVVYVGNAENQKDDQVLEEVMVGPVPMGVNRFILTASCPSPDGIPTKDLLGVTVLLITCSYKTQKFVQIGYYVNNEYAEQLDADNLPDSIDIEKVFRNLLADEPRVTRYAIDWTGANVPPISPDDEDAQAAEGEMNENDDDDALGHLDDMDDEAEDEQEMENDDADDNVEIDLAADEQEDEQELEDEYEEEEEGDEEDDGEGEEMDEDEEGAGATGVVARSEYEEYFEENNNTMDIERMIQQ